MEQFLSVSVAEKPNHYAYYTSCNTGFILGIRPVRTAEQSAIHPNSLPRNKRRAISRQKRDGARDIGRHAHPTEGSQLGPRARIIASLILSSLDLDGAGRDTIHRDPILPQLDGGDFGEHLDSAF